MHTHIHIQTCMHLCQQKVVCTQTHTQVLPVSYPGIDGQLANVLSSEEELLGFRLASTQTERLSVHSGSVNFEPLHSVHHQQHLSI